MQTSVTLEEAKTWIYLGLFVCLFFCLDLEKGEINFCIFSVDRDEGRSVYTSTGCFKKKNLRGLYGLQKGLSIGRTVHFNAVPSGANV